MADLGEESGRLRAATAECMATFEALRNPKPDAAPIPFWDIIVLTATDEQQAQSYQLQLEAKQKACEIPKAEYHVFADPPGPKIGNGGATLYALSQLEEQYGAKLDSFKVLLIHAGGYSKRLPHVSVVGKIFAALPLGNPMFQMLEMKMALSVHYPARMSPGVYVTCADDIVLLEGELDFTAPGVTALGHPSSLTIGTTHGVFVLDEASKAAAARENGAIPAGRPACVGATCSRFLHKPSEERMGALGAVIPGSDQVYTDSAYFLDRSSAKLLLEFYRAHHPLTCEIDAYGDFLQALGPDATDEYTKDAANVIAAEGSLAETRLALFHHLKGTRLNVVLCDVSKFYHIGTISEYLFHYCVDDFFRTELQTGALTLASSKSEVPANTCVLHSTIAAGVAIGAESVVEFCSVGEGAQVGSKCIVSGLTIKAGLKIPDGVFLHATCVKGGWVSLVFATTENLKSNASAEDAPARLSFCGAKLGDALSRLGLAVADVWPKGGKCSLWSAALFPVYATQEESVACALQTVLCSRGLDAGKPDWAGRPRLAMPDILVAKDIDAVIRSRTALRAAIAPQ